MGARTFSRPLRWLLPALLAWLGPALRAQTDAQPALTPKELVQGFRDGYVLAKPRAAHRATADAAEDREGTRRWKKFDRFGGLRVFALQNGESPAAAITRLQATGRYEFVEPDYLKHAYAVPNDPSFSAQWGLNNTGTNTGVPGPGLPGADIHAEAAWDTRTDASSVVVAVIDSGIYMPTIAGVRTPHSDIAANLWVNPQVNTDGFVNDLNGIDSTVPASNANSGYPNDTDGHGTHVSGIIGAVGNDGTNTTGVAWKVQLMELRFITSSGSGSTSNEITCLNYALTHGAKVINASFGSSESSQAEFTALQALATAGVIFVAAAANDSEDNDLSPSYPASYLLDNIVAVACSDNRDDSVFFTSYGSGIVDLYAPGYNILSLYNTGLNATATLSGTSMSTPLVTGSLALLRAQYPSDTYRQLINRLLRAVDLNPNLTGKVQTGGRLNLAAAITSAPGANTPFNDNFANRSHLTGSLLTIRGSNAGATLEAGEPSIAGATGGASLWWEWTAPLTGTVTLTATLTAGGSPVGALVGVYTGSSLATLVPVATNAATGNAAATVTFSVQAGVTYELTADGANGAGGLTILNLGYANNAFATPVVFTGASAQTLSSNIYANLETGEPKILNNAGGHSLWYAWTAPASGQYQFSAYSYDFDPLLAVYTGSSLSSLTLVTSSAGAVINASLLTPASLCTCTFTAAAGTTYHIALDGRSDSNAANEQFVAYSAVAIGAGQFTLTLNDSRWQATAGDSVTCGPTVGTDGTVYVGADNSTFYAFNADGSTKWTYPAGGSFDSVASALSPDGTAVYASCEDGYVYALNATTGALLWRYAVTTSPPSTSPAVAADGTVYVKDGGNVLYALTSAGALKWSYLIPSVSTSILSNASYGSASIAPDGTVYIGSENSTLSALNPATGALKWKFVADSPIFTAPAIDAAGNLYFGTLSGRFYSVNSAGTQLWTFTAGNSISSSPALGANGAVYFGCYDKKLYALTAASGALQWAYTTGGEIRASSPAVDANGVIYVGSYDNNVYAINANGTLNRLYATGDWVRSSPVIAGTSLYFGSNDHRLYAFNLGVGAANSAWPMYMDNSRRFGRAVATTPPAITAQPQTTSVNSGGTLSLAVTATNASSYQWYLNGTAIAGATSSTYTATIVGASQAGAYTVLAANANGTTTSSTATVTVVTNARLADISTLANVGGGNVLNAGFVISGTGTKSVLVRGIGPTLGSTFKVSGSLAATQLTLYDIKSAVIAVNSGWANAVNPGASTASATLAPATATLTSNLGAFALAANSADSALVAGLAAGNYSAGVASPTGGSGLALAEVYDADAANSTARLANVSTLANAGGTNVLDAGFVISGTTDETVLIRAVGPTLGSGFAVSGALANPRLTLNDGNGNVIAINTGWTNAPTLGASTVRSAVLPATATLMTAAGAFALTANSADSALIVTLPPGSYTALVTSPTGATGLSLVEVYELR